ncbi:hypothetical protein [Aeromonas sp. NJAU223]|uniref:hypothetical protein n=1 Tax=Aeromonas sp. NJAU223 TaxID=3115650 RepID=UPI003DA8C31E
MSSEYAFTLSSDELSPKAKEHDFREEIKRTELGINFPKNVILEKTRLVIIGEYSFDISLIQKKLQKIEFHSFLGVIAWMTNNDETGSLINIIPAFRSYINLAYVNGITVKSLSSFLDSCRSHEVTHGYFSFIKRFLKKWHELNLPGITDDVIDFISQVQLPQPKRPAGSKIRSDDPTEGWYTDSEFDSLVQAIWRAYESGVNSLWRTCILLLSAQFGRRPIQIAHLKILDLKETGASCGVSGRRIEFPGAKDRSANGFRQSKIEVHPISDELWFLCKCQAEKTILRFETVLGQKLTPKEKLNLPLFPSISDRALERKLEASTFLHKVDSAILASPVLHIPNGKVSIAIMMGPYGETIISHRTGRPLVQNAYRFRYTRARQLARSGVPRAVLKYWLGHETDYSIDTYYDDPAERARVLNDQIAPLLAPLAQAFQGNLKDSEASAARGDDPASRIELDGQEALGVGTCGEHGFCSASVPIPCYRCTKFQPWVLGPHHEVLNRLLERQRLENEVPRPGLKRRLLVPLQLDKDIQAVMEVISLCEARKAELRDSE